MNILDLFGGCGGLSHGFVENGCKVVCCNEYEEAIAATYKLNNPNANVIIDDITKTSTKQAIYSNFNKKNPCKIVIGGPPCVAYSLSGIRDPRDPRGQLFKEYVEVVNKLKPPCFVMENVKGILSIKHDKENLNEDEKRISDEYYSLEREKISLEQKKLSQSRGKTTEPLLESEINRLTELKREIRKRKKDIDSIRIPVSDKIIQEFKKIGYTVKYKLLNSADYGVPQRRERVIFVGMKNTRTANRYSFPEPTHKGKWVSVKNAIDDLTNIPEDIAFSHIFTKHSPDTITKIKNTKIGESMNPKYKEAFFRCYPDRPSTTVKENHGGVFLHYSQNRVMTPRELARLQSFPDTFKFSGTKSNILKQLGNAVPCDLSAAIAKSILSVLE